MYLHRRKGCHAPSGKGTSAEGIRVAVLRSSVPTDNWEDWYERQLKAGVEVVICRPMLVETGLDPLAFPTFYGLSVVSSICSRQSRSAFISAFIVSRTLIYLCVRSDLHGEFRLQQTIPVAGVPEEYLTDMA